MDRLFSCTDDQKQSPASLTESQTENRDTRPIVHSPAETIPSALNAYAGTVPDCSDPIDKSTKTNGSTCLSAEKSTNSDCLKHSQSSHSASYYLSLSSDSVSVDNNLSVYSCSGTAESALPLLPHQPHDLILPPADTSSELNQKPPLSFPLNQDSTSLEPFGAVSSISADLMARPASPHSDSSESDTAIAPVSHLYIFESETQDFIPNVDEAPHEIQCPDFRSQTRHECDSADVLTKSHHSFPEEQDYKSDMRRRTGLGPPVANASGESSMSVNGERGGKTEVRAVSPQVRQSDSPDELWLDACQDLAGEDPEDVDVLDRTSHYVMQGQLSITSDLSFLCGETQESGCKAEGCEGIGWSCEDTRASGPLVERQPSVDSWASALSDWTGIIVAPSEDITPAFAELGTEIDALTQALAEVSTDTEKETSKEGQSQKTAKRSQSQSTMGILDQPPDAQYVTESSILAEQDCFSSLLKATGPELQDRVSSHSTEAFCDHTQGEKRAEEIQHSQSGSLTYPIHPLSALGSSSATVVSPGGYSTHGTADSLVSGSKFSTDLDLLHFDGYVDLDTDMFMSEEEPVILNIIEDSDLEEQSTPVWLMIGETSADGLCEVTNEHGPGSVDKQKAKRSCGSNRVGGGTTIPSADPCFLTKHALTHVQGADTQPGLRVDVHTHVLPDTLPDVDGSCQVESQWGSPKFIMPLAPLSTSSSLGCRKGSSLERDQISAKRSLNDNRGPTCDHIQPCLLWPTSDGINNKPSPKGYKEPIQNKENTIDSTEKYKGNLDLHRCNSSKCLLTEKKTIIEEINALSRGISNLAVAAADHSIILEKSRVAIITLDINDPFVSRPAKPVTAVPFEPQPNQTIAEKMPHKSHKHSVDNKTRSKKDKSAGHHHNAQASKKQENVCNVSGKQTCKQQEVLPITGENCAIENARAEFEDNPAILGIETSKAAEKAPSKTHGKKKKKHVQDATAQKNVVEPLVDEENGAKPKTAKGRIDMFEAKLGAKAEKTQKDRSPLDVAGGKNRQLEAKAPQAEKPVHHTDHKDQQPKNSTSPLKDDIIKRRRMSEDKFGKILKVLESKLPKPDVQIKGKTEESKVDEATRKKAYSEVVKQKIPPKEDPKVVQLIQAVSVNGDPQSLCLWCQFAAVFSDYTVTWSREGTVLAEIKRSAGDESRVSLTISNTSHKDLGKYQCCLSSLHGSVTLDYLLTYEVLSEIVIPPSPKAIPSAPVEMGGEEEDALCSRLMFKEDFLSDQYFGDDHPVSILTEKVHFGEGMHRRAFRTKLQAGQTTLLLGGHSGVLKVHTAISYGTKNNEELVEKNFSLAVEECQVQNTAREYIKVYTAAAQSVEAFGEVPEIIPIYLVHRPSNDIPYATLEEELIGNFVKYSVKDGKEINLLRKDSVAGQKCCAFQHWVYQNTEGNLLVTDMQGVGMRLTDVGIATCKKGYKGFKGNCSTSFIDQFKALHQCNMYCEILGLASLQPKSKKSMSAPKNKTQPPAAPKKKTFGPTVKGKS
ncbi:alpha-protein kinase 2 [Solea solea]|uniref:alpha-protein kinase 2 n=1 Tax=Solea solea TaxID=90069 RepID=UPI00272D9CE3|nr:alpha-protein kinase 2 [Solea solea]XP_058473338.1 alpha-protein kinase 2 [Solea solea]XP_058473339.1 alpha-protein kinase 2 [Solea solea]